MDVDTDQDRELAGDAVPLQSPPQCDQPLLWSIARWLFADHQAGPDGLCIVCRPAELDPCPARRLAAAGLRAACGNADEPADAAWLDELRARLTAGDLDPVDAPAEAIWAARLARQGR